MKRMHGQAVIFPLLWLALVLAASCESTSDVEKPHPATFDLTVDKPVGTVPDTVTFTGRLSGDIDTLRMCYPTDFSFCAGVYAGGCIFPSPPCDSTQSAKRTYAFTYIYQDAGTYKAMMLLHCKNGSFLDSVTVHVE